jgi:hypothetical protein
VLEVAACVRWGEDYDGGAFQGFGVLVPIANLQVRVFITELGDVSGVRRDQNNLNDK